MRDIKLILPIAIKFPIRAYKNSIIDNDNCEVIRIISDYELPGELSIREKREFLEYVCFVFNQQFEGKYNG
jgi:hypothetical protein